MASFWFNKGGFKLADRTIDFAADTIKTVLIKSSYTPNKDHDFLNDLTAHECDVAGYAGGFNGAGRKALGTKTIAQDDTNDRTVWDAADPTAWSLAAGNTLRYSAQTKEVTDDTLSLPIWLQDFGSDKVTNGGTFTLQFAAEGIAYQQN